jgi:hypothetical protein
MSRRPADLDVGQVAAAHLVVQQVTGQAGEPDGFTDRVGQPLGWVRRRLAGLGRYPATDSMLGCLIRSRRDRAGKRIVCARCPAASSHQLTLSPS